jgi:hypothetical protein
MKSLDVCKCCDYYQDTIGKGNTSFSWRKNIGVLMRIYAYVPVPECEKCPYRLEHKMALSDETDT